MGRAVLLLLLLVGVMLSCLGIFLSLPATSASEVPEVPSAGGGARRAPQTSTGYTQMARVSTS